MPTPELTGRILAAAIEAIEGDERPGQTEMAAEVARTIDSGEHLLVQAGTGTGKSLGYLAPALAALSENPEGRVVIATATLALQAQLANKDIPAAVAACEKVTGKVIRHAVLKGRSNYACLLRVREGGGVEQDALVPDAAATPACGRRGGRAAHAGPRSRRPSRRAGRPRRRPGPHAVGLGAGISAGA